MKKDWFKEIEVRRRMRERRRKLWIILFVLLGLAAVEYVMFRDKISAAFQRLREREHLKTAVAGFWESLSFGGDAKEIDGNLILARAQDSYASIAARVRPAVVNITSQRDSTATDTAIRSAGRTTGGIFFDSASEFVGVDGGVYPDSLGVRVKSSLGSGVIVDPSGYILTNYHVIEGGSSIQVSLFSAGKKTYAARVIKEDPTRDLAVLKIDSSEPFAFAALGNSDLIEVADTVLAIGSPFGLEQTVTKGIISDNKRSLIIEGKEYPDLIQTDAAINRGNSGGPLINVKGEVIGINTAIYAPTGVFTGLGFAIPINQTKPLIHETTD